MPSRSKIDVNKIWETLDTVCTECGFSISPMALVRVGWELVKCPKCGGEFVPVVKKSGG
jgi:hypothetical protein